MNINVGSPELQNDLSFQNFLRDNPGRGTLKVRASSANAAVPVEGVRVIVSKKIGNNTIIFFNGSTDESGMINGISLPTPPAVSSDEVVPKFADYNMEAIYPPENMDKNYSISICCSVSVIQYINITPEISVEEDDLNGN